MFVAKYPNLQTPLGLDVEEKAEVAEYTMLGVAVGAEAGVFWVQSAAVTLMGEHVPPDVQQAQAV